VRLGLALSGRMPVTRSLPVSWHETPNIHFCTIADFEALTAQMGLTIERRAALHSGKPAQLWPNLTADTGVFVLSR
jgi:methionine biosynthesis protein MetW